MDSDFTPYKNAPITEAVIEIRMQPSVARADSVLEKLAESFKSDFPKIAPIHLVQMGLEMKQAEAPPTQTFSQTQFGFRLTNADDSRVLQLRNEAFAYSHLAPYTKWETFRSEAKRMWERFRMTVSTEKPTRCGLRYINRIDVPENKIEVYDYFALYPKIPENMPQQDVIGMVLNLQMPQFDLDCMATINQAQVAPAKPGHLSFLLDIDLFRMNIEDWSDTETWAFLDKLRVRKNQIFESCITERTRGLFA